MTLSTLWPLCLLPLIGILIIFYLLKQPAKEKLLSSLAFWHSAYKQQHSEKPWEKFRHNLLMYLQILTILLLILSLCAPVLRNAATPAEHILLIFDTSGSMQTLYSKDGTTRLEQAKKEAEKLISSINSHTEITIISCSDQAQILLSNSSESKKIRSVINSIEANDCTGSLNSAVSFCDSICSQWDKARCIFFTDSSLDTKNLLAQIYDLSTNPDAFSDSSLLTSNLAVYSCYCYEDDNGFSLQANIRNTGNKTISSDINFYWNDTIIAVEPCKVPAGDFKFISTTISNDKIESCNQIKIEIQEQDALSKDNIFYAIYNQQEENRILLASKQNSFLENALKTVWHSSENIYKITSIKDYNAEETYALSIFDGIYPEQLPKSGSVILFPDSKHMKASSKKIQNLVSLPFDGILKNKYVNLSTSSVSNYLQEMAFPVAKLFSMQAPSEAENIFKLDNGKSGGYITRNNGSFLTVFGFDLHDTDFPLQTEFPILMYNLCQKSLTHTDFSLNNATLFVEAGNTITFFPSDIGKRVSIRNEEKKEIKSLTPSSLSSSTILYQSGFYDFYTKSKKHHAYIAINFAADTESNILEVPEFISKDQKQTNIKKASSLYEIPLQKLFLILALLFLIVEFILWSYQQLNKKQRPFFLAIRSFFIFLLCLSLLDISITMGRGSETTIFLVDVSDSMKKDLPAIESQLEHAIKTLPSNSKAGIVAFGANSCIEHFISKQIHFNQLETTPITSATNIEHALQTASSMFSASDSKRIVLLTDGLENEGMAKNISSTILENGISLKVMKFNKGTYEEVLISNVHVNEHLTIGEKFQVEVTVLSNVNTSATLSLYSGDTLKAEKEVSLTSGSNRFLFYDTLTKGGLNSYRAIIEANQDSESINNEYLTFTYAEEKSKILLIEGKPEEAKEFEKILKAAQIAYEKIPPEAAPKKTLNLQRYSVVICENVHADDLPEKFKAILTSYVENGGSFIAIGGDNSFALGNYQDSVLDDILPVTSTLVGENKVPETAMALVIDHSGSMQNGNSYVSRLSLAKEAAISALTSLRKTDSIGVLEFDDSYNWVVPFTKAENIEEIQRNISSIQINGGTSIYPALSEAVKVLSAEKAKLKHIILLTDGEDGFRDYEELYRSMEEQNITLSTVAISDGADTTLLKSMAEAGQGRYYYADISTDIPRIFAQEVYLSSDSYLINREFMPSVLGNPLVLRPLIENGLQPLYGYIRTTLQPTAYSLLVSDTRDPILAMKNYGLGTSIAFTTDVTNEWTKDYAGLDSYASFWKTLIENSMIETNVSDTKLTITTENMITHIGYETLSTSEFLKVTAVCTDEDGNSFSVPLSAVSPYYFEGSIELEHTGIYSITVTENNILSSSSTIHTSITTSAFASQYSKEYQIYDDDSTIDDLISLTNAEEITDSKEFYTGDLKVNASSHSLTTFFLLLVLFLFIIDIAARRFGFLSFHLKKQNRFIKLIKKEDFFQKVSPKISSNFDNSNISLLQAENDKEKLTKVTPKKEKLKKKKTEPELLDINQLLTSKRTKK